jgi:hypothetical protein
MRRIDRYLGIHISQRAPAHSNIRIHTSDLNSNHLPIIFIASAEYIRLHTYNKDNHIIKKKSR